MITSEQHRRKVIRQKLAQLSEAEGKAVAEVAAETWIPVVSHIAPVIGDDGVRALYNRTLQLMKSAYPWLAHETSDRKMERPITELPQYIKDRDLAEVMDFIGALLLNFSELLATLIGEHLTTHLIRSAWGDNLNTIDARMEEH